jgi:enoyl-CoA hydratase/carnithine racemase
LPDPAELLETAGLQYRVDGVLATVTLSRPQRRNAQDPAMWAGLRAIGAALAEDVSVVVVRAEGRSFSAGIDRALLVPALDASGQQPGLADLASLTGASRDARLVEYQEAFSWLRRPGLISIAAVQGHAVGAGFQLALACDLRVLSDDASLSMRETSLGLVPDLGGTGPLVAAVGYSRALEICVTGRWIGAVEAGELGLATIVVPLREVDAAVADLVSAVTAAPYGAVTATKALLLGAATTAHAEQLRAERSAQAARIRDLAARARGNHSGTGGVGPTDE